MEFSRIASKLNLIWTVPYFPLFRTELNIQYKQDRALKMFGSMANDELPLSCKISPFIFNYLRKTVKH